MNSIYYEIQGIQTSTISTHLSTTMRRSKKSRQIDQHSGAKAEESMAHTPL